jgi:hypothetical protein
MFQNITHEEETKGFRLEVACVVFTRHSSFALGASESRPTPRQAALCTLV